MIDVDKDNLQSEVLDSEIPVIIDFWAAWCGPCRALAPLLNIVADENRNIKIVKVNVDDHSDIAQKYNVSSIPTLVRLDKGVETARHIGVMNKTQLDKWIAS